MKDNIPKYVYILSDYEEEGAMHVTATLDRDKVKELLLANWKPEDFKKDTLERASKGLDELLRKSDEELSKEPVFGKNLTYGWGGPQLHVVRLK